MVQSKLEHCSVIGSYLELQILDFNLVYMARKLRHRPKTFMGESKTQFCCLEIQILATTEKSESVLQPRHCSVFSPYVEFQKSKCTDLFFVGKLRQFPRTFMRTICSNSDVSNDVLFRKEDKNCHQVKMWPPTQQLVIKSILLNFGL